MSSRLSKSCSREHQFIGHVIKLFTANHIFCRKAVTTNLLDAPTYIYGFTTYYFATTYFVEIICTS